MVVEQPPSSVTSAPSIHNTMATCPYTFHHLCLLRPAFTQIEPSLHSDRTFVVRQPWKLRGAVPSARGATQRCRSSLAAAFPGYDATIHIPNRLILQVRATHAHVEFFCCCCHPSRSAVIHLTQPGLMKGLLHSASLLTS